MIGSKNTGKAFQNDSDYTEEDISSNGPALVSILIPLKNGEKYIAKCIKSLEESDYPKEKFELIVVDGGSVDRTVDIIKKLQKKHKNIHLIYANGTNTSAGRNIAIEKARGDIIINFSGHAVAEKNFIKILTTKLRFSENYVAGVGCKDEIPPDQSSSTARYIDCITNTMLGGTIMHQHMKFDRERFADSISFTAYRKDIFEKVGLFDPAIPSGDDAEFNFRIRKAGYKLLYTPATCVYRYRRETIKDFLWQMFNYGRARTQIIKKHPASIRLAYVFPALFVMFLFIFPILFFLNNVTLHNTLMSGIFIYPFLLFLFSIKPVFLKKDLKVLIICPILYFVQHTAYGLGLILETIHFKRRPRGL